jgi:tetratricopeptide (TPR) repeat protein
MTGKSPGRRFAQAGALLSALTLVGFMVGAQWGSGWLSIPAAAGELQQAERRYRELGLPWEAADLSPSPPVEPEENAAPLLRQICETMPGTVHADERRLRDLLGQETAEALALAEAKLEEYEEILALAHRAAKRPQNDFQPDWDFGPEVVFEDLGVIRSAVKMLGHRADLHARQGRFAEASEDVLAARRLSQHLGSDPRMLALLAQTGGAKIAIGAAERALESARGNRSAIRGLRAALEQPMKAPDLRHAMRGEMYLGIATVRNLPLFQGGRENADGERAPINPSQLLRTGAPRDLMQRASLARYLQNWTEAFEAMEDVGDDPRDLARELRRVSERIESRGLSNMLNAVMHVSFAPAADSIVKAEAARQRAIERARVLEFEAVHGRSPESLEEVGDDPG